jgi:hypothetical protein
LDYEFRINNPNLQEHAEELYYTGQIDKKTFDHYTTSNKKSTLLNPSTDGAAYTECLSYISDPSTSVADARNFIMKKYNQDLLAPEDRNRLYDLSIRHMGNEYKSVRDIIGLEQTKKDEAFTYKKFLNSALDLIHNYIPFSKRIPDAFYGQKGKSKADDKSVQMAKQFIKKILDENTPPDQYLQKANEIIKQERLADRPEISQYGDDGQVEQDENGIRNKTNNDGSTESIQESDVDLDVHY